MKKLLIILLFVSSLFACDDYFENYVLDTTNKYFQMHYINYDLSKQSIIMNNSPITISKKVIKNYFEKNGYTKVKRFITNTNDDNIHIPGYSFRKDTTLIECGIDEKNQKIWFRRYISK